MTTGRARTAFPKQVQVRDRYDSLDTQQAECRQMDLGGVRVHVLWLKGHTCPSYIGRDSLSNMGHEILK